MTDRITVLEFLRDEGGVWTVPDELVRGLAARFPDVRFLSPPDRAAAEGLLPAADVVYGGTLLREENLGPARRLRWLHVSAAGVGSVLFPALVESPVVVTNARGLHAVSMAEHALALMLAFARKLHRARDLQRERRWEQVGLWTGAPPIGQLAGGTLGLVGLGAVGAAVAERAAALGMRVIAVRPHPAGPAPAHEQWGLERLGEMLARADWVVLAAPHTRATRGMIGAAELARMKPGAVLVNLGRGALVDEPALVAALREGRLAGAALDVTREEPLPADSPLWTMPDVVLTPHVAGLGPRYWERAVAQFADNLERFLAGRPLANVVDKRAGY